MLRSLAAPAKTTATRVALALMTRSVLTDGIEIAGFGLIVAAVFRVSTTLGLAAAGLALILIGVLKG